MEVVDDTGIEAARTALERGELVVVPTDTVYGIAALAEDEAAVRLMYEVKGRDLAQPTAAVFASTADLVDRLGEVDRRTAWAIHALLPGPWTLVVDAPSLAWPWLTGGAPGPIGVRVPSGGLELPPIAATSANLAGRPTAESFAQLDDELVAHVAVAVDRGVLDPAGASTVLDLTAWATGSGEVRILRDPVGRAGQAIAALADGP